MQTFLHRMSSKIKGTLSGFDRVRFRGTIRWLSSLRGMGAYLGTMRILLKDFASWSKARTAEIDRATVALAQEAGRPMIYLPSSTERKETLAMDIARTDNITEGLVAVFKCVEPCWSFKVGPNAQTEKLELRYQPLKCSHLYFYLLDPQLGLTHLRLQMWAPFSVHVCLNGREWLARQLKQSGIGFDQRDNCFVEIDDLPRAQELASGQLRTNWSKMLDRLLTRCHPAHQTMFASRPLEYYWSAEETEWATDVLFQSPEALASVYPNLLHHAITTFGSLDTLRFLGQVPVVYRNTTREVISSFKTRPEGTRIKHSINRNSIKMYDKQQTVLRVETTINDPRDLKVFRTKEGDPDEKKSWLRLRKGVADLQRRAEVSQKSNERYLEGLAAVEHDQSLEATVQTICEPTVFQGRRVRALQPLSPEDSLLLASIIRGEFAINGFRNRDLRPLLFDDVPTPPEQIKRQAAKITRLLRLLRGHGLIQKVPTTHRYTLTTKGRQTIVSLQAAKHASAEKLSKLAV
ncbi:MAG: hypothetical protein E6Q76_08155 [Rhizobium sp.]|nr:MAG: hypothetical protein E6Q76_08155 [Rhizobium sp.]